MLKAQEECGKVLGPGQILEIAPMETKEMITPQECTQLKRELDTGYGDEIEVTPAILVLILTFVVFVIAFWIWLISRSCIFAQGLDSKTDVAQENVSGSRSQTN
ncbi:hypothetical protein KR018_008476 [Drosophila ironensis]|nr:hypothetical protein KR018_008476 [Drosophila ironensis]